MVKIKHTEMDHVERYLQIHWLIGHWLTSGFDHHTITARRVPWVTHSPQLPHRLCGCDISVWINIISSYSLCHANIQHAYDRWTVIACWSTAMSRQTKYKQPLIYVYCAQNITLSWAELTEHVRQLTNIANTSNGFESNIRYETDNMSWHSVCIQHAYGL